MTIDLTVMHGCQNRFAIVDEDVSPIPDARKSALVLAAAIRLHIHGVLFLSAHAGRRCTGGGPAASLRSRPWRHARVSGRRTRELRAGQRGREPGRTHV